MIQQAVRGAHITLERDPSTMRIKIQEIEGNKWIDIPEFEMIMKVKDEMSLGLLAGIILKGTIEQAKEFLDVRKVEYTYFDPVDLLKIFK